MPELRWILVVAGLVLLVGLWFWESRRRLRREADYDADGQPQAAGTEPAASPEPVATAVRAPEDEDLPSIRATRRERGTVGRNPPVIEIPGDAEPELARPGQATGEFVPPSVPYRRMQEELDEIPEDLRNLPPDERVEQEQRKPWVRTQPIDRNDLAGADDAAEDAEQSAAAAAPEPERHAEAEARQRIVALRLIADGRRWTGAALVDALKAEGLSFGKYSIFHRQRDDGKSIFFVASMIEPGSFDLDTVAEQSFPGISVFAVIPGPVDAPTTFDMMLSTARRLVQRLGGHLQDEQGSTLTAQRILNLREELVHFEHVSRRVKKR